MPDPFRLGELRGVERARIGCGSRSGRSGGSARRQLAGNPALTQRRQDGGMKRLLSRLLMLILCPGWDGIARPIPDSEHVRMQLEDPGYQSSRPENGFF